VGAFIVAAMVEHEDWLTIGERSPIDDRTHLNQVSVS